jgi:hypothetical protein
MLEGETSSDTESQAAEVSTTAAATSSLALLALACHRNATEGRSAEDEIQNFAEAKQNRPGRNIFSKAARFARRHKDNFEN